jgi:hypothetical protein
MRSTRTILLAGALALGLLAGCGDDTDEGDTDGADTSAADTQDASGGEDPTSATSDGDDGSTSETTGDDTSTTSTGDAADCPAEVFTGDITREVDGDHAEAALSGPDIVDGTAYGYGPTSFTIYIADHEIDRAVFAEYDEGNFSTDNAVVAEPGGVLATMFVSGEPLEPGSTTTFSDAVPSPIVDSGGGSSASTMGATGELTVIGVDDEQICFEGTVSTEIHQSA